MAAVDANTLPDAPGFSFSNGGDFPLPRILQAPSDVIPPVAPKWKTRILPGQTAVPLSVGDKFVLAFRREAEVGTLLSASASAGYGVFKNSRPHYGDDAPAFGQRFGAAIARQTSQSVFNYGLYSSIFRDDPRYYVLGPAHPFKDRVVYAATRVFVTRKNDGTPGINLPYLLAVASSSALTNAYYPVEDRNVKHTVTGSLTTIGLRMVSIQLKEFEDDIRRKLFSKE